MKAIIVAGARPNFIKIAPLIHELENRPNIEYKLVNTGQHYDVNLADIFFKQLNIPKPHVNLEVGSAPREEQIELIKERFAPILDTEKPDVVVVVGDVTSTIACAESAKEKGIKIAHVEAGLRSFDMDMPEEVNRIGTDRISDYLFVTENSGMQNLEKEGIGAEKVFFVGNVMIDTLIESKPSIDEIDTLEKFALEKGKYVVSTFHRPSNVDTKESLQNIISVLGEITKQAKVVIPLHPRTKASLERNGLFGEFSNMDNLLITPPLGYFEFLNLLQNAKFVVTDSGGIQEETTFLGVPCITMRENTERPVTITEGTNVLVGNDRELLLEKVDEILAGKWKSPSEKPKFWDGKTSGRIWDLLEEKLGK